MAGGILAAEVACMVCLSDDGEHVKATRIHEGDETDEYHCERGHAFGIDWADGPAEEALWPPEEAPIAAPDPSAR